MDIPTTSKVMTKLMSKKIDIIHIDAVDFALQSTADTIAPSRVANAV